MNIDYSNRIPFKTIMYIISFENIRSRLIWSKWEFIVWERGGDDQLIYFANDTSDDAATRKRQETRWVDRLIRIVSCRIGVQQQKTTLRLWTSWLSSTTTTSFRQRRDRCGRPALRLNARHAHGKRYLFSGFGLISIYVFINFRSFANGGRLSRHIAGVHATIGKYRCILCDNRFKYDDNRLYHYRRSCPYTKAFIDRNVRRHTKASLLRKLVHNLAKELN